MYKRAFLFNGIGSKPEKLMMGLSPELKDKFNAYMDDEFTRLELCKELEKNNGYDRKVAEWVISLISDRVVFEHYISKGIVPDIGAGYSSGIVSISACFGSISHEFAHDIIMMNRATMSCLDRHGEKLDMGVIIGIGYSDVRELLGSHFSEDDVMVGSANSIICTMITGREEYVDKALQICLEEGALKAIKFGTGVAYHHPIMQKYSQEYVDFCASQKYNAPDYPIMSIFDNRIMTEGSDVLKENQINVMTPIRWDLALKDLEELGVTEFFDVSANGAVKKFSRVNKRKCKIYTLEEL